MSNLRSNVNSLLENDSILEVLVGARSYADVMHDEINQHNRGFQEWLCDQRTYKDTTHGVEVFENDKWFGLKYTMTNGWGHSVKRFVFPQSMMNYTIKGNRHALNLFFKYLKEV